MVVAGVELALNLLISGTALQNEALSSGARIALTAQALSLLTVAVCAIAAPVWLLAQLRESTHSIAGRRVLGTASVLFIASAVFLYGSSWALFWNTGVFLDGQAVAFLAAMNPVQVFHWVYPPLAVGVVIATIAGTLVLASWAPRWGAGLAFAVKKRLVIGTAAAAAACLVTALVGNAVYGSGSGDPNEPKSDYVMGQEDRAGPVAHVIADVRRHLRRRSEPLAPASADNDRVVRRPIISMDQYLAGVTHSALKRRNVVMVQFESLRSDQLLIYGGRREVMPTIERLAKEARVFTNAYIQASHSNYADLVPLSSHYPLRSPDMYEYPPNPTYPRVLIYDVLKAIGYKTGIFSSQNERWGGMVNYHRESSLDRFLHAATFSGPTQTPWADLGFAEWVKETKGAGSIDDKYTVNEAIKWLDGVAGQPFFIHMNLQASHVPYVIPDDFPHKFSPKTLDFAIMWAKFPIEKIDIVKDRYADSLFYEDTQIARLFDYLKKRGLWENTIVIVGGDNGEAFYEHGFASHASSLFNEVMKVPMIIHAPDLGPGLDDRPAMFLDIAPSLFDLLGLPPHPSFQGISLFERQPNPNRSIYMIVQTPAAFQSAIVRSGFKLLYNELDGRYFLYDLINDPGETPQRNLAASRPDLVSELDGRLKFWRGEQLRYYADVARQSREYPPVVKD